jgi:DNA-binding CsgD family transcriptional regulator
MQTLTPAEADVLQRCADGQGSMKRIARERRCSMDTIRTHLRTARAKLGATNTAHAVAVAKRLDLIT